MSKVFVAVEPKTESEKYIVSLTERFRDKTKVLLGDIVGYYANFYEFSGMTPDESDSLAKEIMKDGGDDLYRVAKHDNDMFNLGTFVMFCTVEQ